MIPLSFLEMFGRRGNLTESPTIREFTAGEPKKYVINYGHGDIFALYNASESP